MWKLSPRSCYGLAAWSLLVELEKVADDENRDLCMEAGQIHDIGRPECLVLAGKKGNEMMKFNLNTDIYRPLQQVFAFVTTPENDFCWQYRPLCRTRSLEVKWGSERFFDLWAILWVGALKVFMRSLNSSRTKIMGSNHNPDLWFYILIHI